MGSLTGQEETSSGEVQKPAMLQMTKNKYTTLGYFVNQFNAIRARCFAQKWPFTPGSGHMGLRGDVGTMRAARALVGRRRQALQTRLLPPCECGAAASAE
jgi:hypothetical protein